jgi:WhiB family transcriptional regulator, redox-sensing transcriptional regulator
MLSERPEWMDRANCRGLDPALFFPGRGDHQGQREALKVCGGCEVRGECLEHALEESEHQGVWGGMSERGRKVRRMERREEANG